MILSNPIPYHTVTLLTSQEGSANRERQESFSDAAETQSCIHFPCRFVSQLSSCRFELRECPSTNASLLPADSLWFGPHNICVRTAAGCQLDSRAALPDQHTPFEPPASRKGKRTCKRRTLSHPLVRVVSDSQLLDACAPSRSRQVLVDRRVLLSPAWIASRQGGGSQAQVASSK